MTTDMFTTIEEDAIEENTHDRIMLKVFVNL